MQTKLGFEEVDMPLFVGKQFIEQGAGDVIADLVARAAGLDIERAGIMLGRKVSFQWLSQGLADPQAVQLLQVWMPCEKDDPRDQTDDHRAGSGAG